MFVNYSHYKDSDDQNYRRLVRAFAASGRTRRLAASHLTPAKIGKKAEYSTYAIGRRQIQSRPSKVRRTSSETVSVGEEVSTTEPIAEVLDPFNTVAFQDDWDVCVALRLYTENWAPSQRPGLREQQKYNPLLAHVLPAALQNGELLEATVAMCLSYIASGNGYDGNITASALHHRGLALGAIRTKIKKGVVNNSVVLATTLLMIVDNVFHEAESYRAHLQGLRRMKEALGKEYESAYGGTVTSFVQWGECNGLIVLHREQIDFESREPPLIPPLFINMNMETMLANLPTGFRDLAFPGHLSIPLINILTIILRWTAVTGSSDEDVQSKKNQDFLQSYDPRVTLATMMRFSRTLGHPRSIERCISRALAIFHANVLCCSCKGLGYQVLLQELANVIRNIVPLSKLEKELWTWITLLAANTAKRDCLFELQDELMARLFDFGEDNTDWERVRMKVQKFLWHSKLSDEWKECWIQAEQKRRMSN